MASSIALWIAIALLLLARAAFAWAPSMWGWGLNVQRFLDPVSGWGAWSLAAASLFPPIGRGLARGLAGGVRLAGGSRRPYLVVSLAGAMLVWLMPDRVWFVGDFMIRQGSVESGAFSSIYTGAMPLDMWLHNLWLRPLGAGSIEAVNFALRTLGAIEAGGLAALALLFARTLGARGVVGVAVWGVVFFGGALTMFTGLDKPAGELCLVTVALAAFGIRAARDGRSPAPVAIAIALGLALHRSAVALVPAVLVIAGLWLRQRSWREARGQPGTWIAIVVAALAGALALPRIVSIVAAYDWSHHLMTVEARRQGGLLAAAFSGRHLLDLANLLLAMSPLAVAILPLMATRGRARPPCSEAAVLGTLAASWIPVLLLVQPQQGIFRDWDVFAPAGIACSLWAAWLVREALERAPSRAWLAAPVFAVVAVSSLQWLAVNRAPERGLARVRAFLTEEPGPEPADRPLLWDFLAMRNMRLARWAEAADAAEHTAALAPHRRILVMWAIAETMKGDHRAALGLYRRLLALDPEDPIAWLGLAGEAKRLGDAETLALALAKLRSYPPEGPEMRAIRRHLEFYPQVWPLAGRWE